MKRLEFHIKKVGKDDKFRWAIRNMANPNFDYPYFASRTKTENKFLREFHKWLESATEFTLIAEKEDKDVRDK